MKAYTTKFIPVVIFAGLAALVLISFQNCSSSLAALGFGKRARASDVSEMLESTQNQLDSTVHQYRAKSREINSVSKNSEPLVYGEIKDPEEIKKQIAAKQEQQKLRRFNH